MNSKKKLEEMEVENAEVLSNGTTNANETNNNDSNFKMEKVDIFHVVGTEESAHVVLGNYRMTEAMSFKEALKDAKRTDWDRLLQVMGSVVDIRFKQEEKQIKDFMNKLKEETDGQDS